MAEDIARLRSQLKQSNALVKRLEHRLFEYGRLVKVVHEVIAWNEQNSIGSGCGVQCIERLKMVLNDITKGRVT